MRLTRRRAQRRYLAAALIIGGCGVGASLVASWLDAPIGVYYGVALACGVALVAVRARTVVRSAESLPATAPGFVQEMNVRLSRSREPGWIALIGYPGSGKSGLAQALAREYEWPLIDFGKYVRQVAGQRGLPTDSDALLRFGPQLLNEQGSQEFVNAAMTLFGVRPGGLPVIVSDVYHESVRAALTELLGRPMRFRIVLANEARERSLHLTHEQIDRYEHDPIDIDLPRLSEDATTVTAESTDELAALLSQRLNELFHHRSAQPAV